MTPAIPEPDRPSERPVTLLVVDDDARVIELLEIAFGAYGWRVVRAGDGETALRLAGRERPDLMVLDVRLPRRSGLDVVDALRHDPLLADLPVIMVSAMAETDARVQGLARGADDYLVKPFSPKELVARVRRLLARSREAREARRLGIAAEIELTRARDEAQRHHQELRHARGVHERATALARELARRGDREDLAESFLAAFASALHVGVAALLAPAGDPSRLEPLATRGAGAERLFGLTFARDGEMARIVDGLGRVVRVAELERFPELDHAPERLAAAGVTLLAPVAGAEGLEAVLVFDDKRDGTDLTRAEHDLVRALLDELGPLLLQQRRLEAQAETAELLLRVLADRAEPAGAAARAEAAGWLAALARERTGSWLLARRVAAAVRLGDWLVGESAAVALADAAARDVTGRLARLAALAGHAAARLDEPEEAILVRVGWAWSAARVAGLSHRAALERALEECAGDPALAAMLRRSAPAGAAGTRDAA